MEHAGVEHIVVFVDKVFLVTVAGEITLPPVPLVPAVLVVTDGLVVEKPVPVISLQPLLPLLSVFPRKTSLIPAPKLTV